MEERSQLLSLLDHARRFLLVQVPAKSYWLVAGYLCFLLFLFLFRNAAIFLSIRGFWIFFALALVAAYAVFLVLPLFPAKARGVLQLGLYLLASTYFLVDSGLNLANTLVVMCIGIVLGAFLYGLRGAGLLAVFQTAVLYLLFDQPDLSLPTEKSAEFFESVAGLWILAIFAGVVAEVFHERGKENQRLREQVERQERLSATGELTGGLDHELRNPLLIIKGAGELIAESTDPKEVRELAMYITGEVKRLNGLLSTLLDFAKPETMRFEPMDLQVPLKGACEEVRVFVEASKKPVTLHYTPGKAMEVTGDAQFLKQAFLNLLLNAVEAIPATGQIWVRTGRELDTGDPWVEIRDNGTGISQQDLKRIFNPFFSMRDKGVGLGLSVTQRILDAHQCRMTVESQLGQGTQFRIAFPRDGVDNVAAVEVP